MTQPAGSLLLLDAFLLDSGPAIPAHQKTLNASRGAILIRNGRITAIGPQRRVKAQAGPDVQVLGLAGRCVTPGLVDSHCHLESVGHAKLCLDLSHALNKSLCLSLVRKACAQQQRQGWLIGQSLNINTWPPADRNPRLAELDDAAAGPVVLFHFDGHSCWANSAALCASGIAQSTADPPGGRLGRDPQNHLNGFLYEHALALLRIPAPSLAQRRQALQLAIQEYASLGYTSVHVMAAGPHESIPDVLDLARSLRTSADALLRVRGYPLYSHLQAALDHLQQSARDAAASEFERIAGIKTFFDGSLNSGTAWMLAPYADDGDNAGMPVISPGQLREQISACNKAGLPLACHAIGDRAVREALDAFEAAASPHLVNRIEHAQHVNPSDWPRFPRIGIVASMQACHLLPDWPVAARLLGPRAAQTYALRSAIEAGAAVILGSDAPVVRADPRDSLLAAVWRCDNELQPPGGWHASERVSAAQWLWMHTLGPALATGEAADTGRLAVGFRADLTIWNQNPLDAARSPQDIHPLRADATLVNGLFSHSALSP